MNKVIEILRKEASTNPAFNAICHSFALRERARYQVTVQALHYRMATEGFAFKKEEYQTALKFLGALGFGAVKYNKRAEPIGLYGITSTLQSIGKAAIGGESKLKGYKQRHKFSDLPLIVQTGSKKVTEALKTVSVPKKIKIGERIYPVSLTIMIGNKPVNFRIPTSITEEEIESLVEVFADRAMGAANVEFPVAMTAVVKGTPVNLQVPKNITSKEIAHLVVRFHDKGNT